MKYLFFLLIYSTLISCSQVLRNNESFDEHDTLYAKKEQVREIISPNFITKKGDFLIVASSNSNPMLYMYSLPSLELVSTTGNKGRGPNEIPTFPMFCESSRSPWVYIWGYQPTTLFSFDVSAGNFNKIGEHHLSRYEEFNNMHVLSDSLFLFYLPDQLTIKKYDLKNQKWLNEIVLKKDSHNESFFYRNRGYMAANDSYVIYAYYFKKQIDIYDLRTFKLKIRINDGKTYAPPVPGSFEQVTYQYSKVYAGANYFYVLHNGIKRADGSYINKSLEVYDYEGNAVKNIVLIWRPTCLLLTRCMV